LATHVEPQRCVPARSIRTSDPQLRSDVGRPTQRRRRDRQVAQYAM